MRLVNHCNRLFRHNLCFIRNQYLVDHRIRVLISSTLQSLSHLNISMFKKCAF
uniref:Uncharacterized protein n=1 Tax=Solanum tuberosum TaxID=4113 RepID=M1D7C3_SOLTU